MTPSQRIKTVVDAIKECKAIPQLISERYVAGVCSKLSDDETNLLNDAAFKANAQIFFDHSGGDHVVVLFVMRLVG